MTIPAIPLMKANLKGFVRNWKTVLILVILPLIMIGSIFLAFNPKGLRTVDIGYSVTEQNSLDDAQFQEAVGSFAHLTRYESIEACMQTMRSYKEYVCINISGTGPYVLNVIYDNTREPVIWEIIQRIDAGVRTVQKRQSKTIATDFLTRFKDTLNRLDEYDRDLGEVHGELGTYANRIDSSTRTLQDARSDLIDTLTSMDRDIASARGESRSARDTKDAYSTSARQQLGAIEWNLQSVATDATGQMYLGFARNAIISTENSIEELDSGVERRLDALEDRLTSYEQASYRGKTYAGQMSTSITALQTARSDLTSYQQEVTETRKELSRIKNEFHTLTTLDAETIVNPVVVYNRPAYIPLDQDDYYERLKAQGKTDTEIAVQGASFISLQTMFPGVLVLITVFLALLIGSFVALSEINSSARPRVRLVHGIFFHEFIATFISAIIIVSIPVLIVLFIGNGLFRLNVFNHLGAMVTLLALVLSIIVLLGSILAYSIRKESLTLMISTFLLVLLIFFSGFLLPIERMSPFFGTMAANSPGALALGAFKQIVFYNAQLSGVMDTIVVLCVQCIVLLCVAIAMKALREQAQ